MGRKWMWAFWSLMSQMAGNLIILVVFIMSGLLGMLAALSMLYDPFRPSFIPIVVSVVIGIFGVPWIWSAVWLNIMESRKYSSERAEEFYKECIKKGIKNLSDSTDRQRLQLLIADMVEFEILDIDPEKLFEIGEKSVKDRNKAEKDKKWNEVRSSELKRESEEKKISEMPPRDKRVYLCKKEVEYYRNCIDSTSRAINAAEALSKAMQEKEKDGSVSAGIASGIGGVVPAAMTAARIEKENQDIRARNAARQASLEPVQEEMATAGNELLELLREKTKWSKKIEMAKIKLVDEKHPAEELFAAMKITRPMIEQSETGAVVVSVRASSEQVYKIGKNKAVIDGIIIAKLVSKGGEPAGCARLCLPAEGIQSGVGPEKLSGICTSTQPGQHYTVELSPGKLWLIEE